MVQRLEQPKMDADNYMVNATNVIARFVLLSRVLNIEIMNKKLKNKTKHLNSKSVSKDDGYNQEKMVKTNQICLSF